MSIPALNGVYGALPALRAHLAESDPHERPSYDAALAVALHLANRHRIDRGYVDESVDQIAADLDMAPRKVRRCLAALDGAGLFAPTMKANQHRATRREARFLIDGAASARRTEQDHEASSARRTEQDEEQRPLPVSAASATGRAASATGISSVRLADASPDIPVDDPQHSPVVGTGIATRRPGLIEGPAHLAQLYHHAIATALPTQPITKHHDRDLATARKWEEMIRKCADPPAVMAQLEAAITWAARDRFWADRAVVFSKLVDNWPQIFAKYTAHQNTTAASPAQHRGIDAAGRALARRQTREGAA